MHIFIRYQFLIMSSKRSRALSRLEHHNTSPNRVQNEQFVDDSQRKSKKTEKSAEKSNTPHMDENGVRRSLPRRKDHNPAADLYGENAHVSSLLGLDLVASCDRHSTSSSESAHASCRDVSLECGDKRLFKLESEFKRSSK